MKKITTAITLLAFVGACAPKPEDIVAAPTSTAPYLNMSCRQLAAEADGLNAQVASLTGQQAKAANNDAAATAVSLILFWPAVFFVGSSGDAQGQLAAAKGQQEAIRRAWTGKGC